MIDQEAVAKRIADAARRASVQTKVAVEKYFATLQKIQATLVENGEFSDQAVDKLYEQLVKSPRFSELTKEDFSRIIAPGKFTLTSFIHRFYPELR